MSDEIQHTHYKQAICDNCKHVVGYAILSSVGLTCFTCAVHVLDGKVCEYEDLARDLASALLQEHGSPDGCPWVQNGQECHVHSALARFDATIGDTE